MKEKPGVMLYFDIMPAMECLTNNDKGILLQAILDYGRDGTQPELPKKLRALWAFMTTRLDNDDLRYKKTVITKQYAAYARWEKHELRKPLPFVDWMKQEGYERFIRPEDYHADA